MPAADPHAPRTDASLRAWVILITRGSYLPGVVLLIHTLYKHNSRHAIVVQYTDSLEQECIDCIRALPSIYPLAYTQRVEPLPLPEGLSPIATRFDDTLTKLRVFAPLENQKWPVEPAMRQCPREICFLDADIMIFKPIDDIFDIPRPTSDWIAAHHSCTCNIDSDPWALSDWNPENCPLTPLAHPEALAAPIPSSTDARPTYQLLNSGVFVCTPSTELWDRIDRFRRNDERVRSFLFPDQNFLDTFFQNRWVPIPWTYNALKTDRYWHAQMWRDDKVRALHYIVDKPWEVRVSSDGSAGYRQRDGTTHSWWWSEFDAWEKAMMLDLHTSVLDCVIQYVCVNTK